MQLSFEPEDVEPHGFLAVPANVSLSPRVLILVQI